jgi:uncharacterized RDD family membrane protein YckC
MATSLEQRLERQLSPQFSKPDSGKRFLAFAIDWLISVPIGFFAVIPFVGSFVAVCFLVPYWMFRDIGGASIGKRIMGLRVVNYEGRMPSLGKRVRRNALMWFCVLLVAIPVIGLGFFAIGFGIVVILEVVFIIQRGESLSDRDAKCLVVKVN